MPILNEPENLGGTFNSVPLWLCECLWLSVAVPKCQEIADIEHL